MIAVIGRDAALRREQTAAQRIPYMGLVAPSIVKTSYGGYVQAFRLGGASFESEDDEVLNNWHERLNVLWRNIASANTALWLHVIRRREVAGCADSEDVGFGARLAAKYGHRLSTQTLMVNDLYLSVVYRPVAGAAPGLLARIAARQAPQAQAAERADAIEASEKLAQTVQSSLARYEPERLHIYIREDRY